MLILPLIALAYTGISNSKQQLPTPFSRILRYFVKECKTCEPFICPCQNNESFISLMRNAFIGNSEKLNAREAQFFSSCIFWSGSSEHKKITRLIYHNSNMADYEWFSIIYT